MLHDKPSASIGYESLVFTTIVNGISIRCGVNTTENQPCKDSSVVINCCSSIIWTTEIIKEMFTIKIIMMIKLTVIINNGNS